MKIAKQVIWFTVVILGALPFLCFADSLENLENLNTDQSSIVIVNESGLADVAGHGSPIMSAKTSGKIILWDEVVLSNSADALSKRNEGGNTRSSITASCIKVNMYQQSGRR